MPKWTVTLDDRRDPTSDLTRVTLVHAIGRVKLYKLYTPRQHLLRYGVDIDDQGVCGLAATHKAILVRVRERFPKPPQKVGTLFGVRAWNMSMTSEGPILVSFNGYPWYGPVVAADKKPTMYDSSGLYCFNLQNANELSAGTSVVGIVQLLGTVCVHETGYRAEKMIVRRIMVRGSLWPPAKKSLEDRYQCEVKDEHRPAEEDSHR